MIETVRRFRSFGRPIQVLQVNQMGINLGFYMLMPYLADHLVRDAGLAVWTVGLVLGLRSLSQQGLFLVGGTLSDRLGYKPMIMAGCALRTAGFALFGLSGSLPILVVAAVLTGFAGALFNPAARAYLAHEAGARKVEAFALFNVFYQTGILLGPPVGMALLGAGFRAVCLSAAAVFALLAVLQWACLPARRGAEAGSARPVLHDWREAFGNRAFLSFAAAMTASYALSYQMYLGLPLEVRRVTGSGSGVALLYTISALLGVLGQIRLTAWCSARLSGGRAVAFGLLLMGVSFVPLTASPGAGPSSWAALAPVVACVVLLTLGTMVAFPFEMAMITDLGGERLIGTYYGLYNLLSGVGVLAGNLLSGAVIDLAASSGLASLPWLLLAAAGLVSSALVRGLERRGRLGAAVPARAALGPG
ncbi:MDR family MFS transporter [Streptosporangium carneum]|uniref:ABC transporter, permease protein n=1 Tax=Streptosporangium carneum TaxID=47481 RepID=A0A9W6I540_9ACTN|nr:MFS transporter [Streptosporangium carneum]GLK12257.1 putative ABC transporter, permease protein [Streptosporangium carneum]